MNRDEWADLLFYALLFVVGAWGLYKHRDALGPLGAVMPF